MGLVEVFAATTSGVYRPVFGCSVTLLMTTAVNGFLLGCVLLSCVVFLLGSNALAFELKFANCCSISERQACCVRLARMRSGLASAG